MDGRLAVGALLAVPVLHALARWLTTSLDPLTGWALALAAYWAGLGVATWRWGDRERLRYMVEARWPGWPLTLALALPGIVLGVMAMRHLGATLVPAHVLLAAALGAVVNAVLEELFWRGALVPRPEPRALALALGVFTVFHVAWLGVQGLDWGLSPLVAAALPLALGGLWTAALLATGTLGAGILSHAGLNLFLFVQVVAINWGAPAAP